MRLFRKIPHHNQLIHPTMLLCSCINGTTLNNIRQEAEKTSIILYATNHGQHTKNTPFTPVRIYLHTNNIDLFIEYTQFPMTAR